MLLEEPGLSGFLCIFLYILVIIVHSPELLIGLSMIRIGGTSRVSIDKFTMRISLILDKIWSRIKEITS